MPDSLKDKKVVSPEAAALSALTPAVDPLGFDSIGKNITEGLGKSVDEFVDKNFDKISGLGAGLAGGQLLANMMDNDFDFEM